LAGAAKQHSSEFVIRNTKLDLHIYLSSTDNLLLHEETIADRVEELKREFLHDEVVRDPVVVDTDSCVVLDGMHRVVALRELDCTCIPVCAVDYLNPGIKVGTWYRSISGKLSPDVVKVALSASGLRCEAFPFDIWNITENPTLAILFAQRESFRLKDDGTQVFDTLRTAEQCLQKLGLAIKFETESDALENLVNKKTDAVMTLPKIDKASVERAGLTGQLLPHKVTRHIIPARPLGVNVPLIALADQRISLTESNQRLVSSLRARGIIHKPSGAVIEGRRYEEETFIFK
jgi:L-serine kinase (ADP)